MENSPVDPCSEFISLDGSHGLILKLKMFLQIQLKRMRITSLSSEASFPSKPCFLFRASCSSLAFLWSQLYCSPEGGGVSGEGNEI